MSSWPVPSLHHVGELTDDVGIVEHARLATPRHDLGYCTDDAGRALAVASALPDDPAAQRVAEVALGFLVRAHLGAGRFRLRLRPDGAWTNDPPSDDAAARAILGFGVAAARAPWPSVRAAARELFDAAACFRSGHPRAMAYASLGAVEVLSAAPGHAGAARLVESAASLLFRPGQSEAWRWSEPRLAYANALLPEAMLAIASATARDHQARRALLCLDWLVREETLGQHFSFTPVGGRGPSDGKPGFDQQPIEAWAMADACARAWSLTGDAQWAEAVARAAAWFIGDNDVGVAMFDSVTGGGYDGLELSGVNRNQGAESALAFVATMARVRAIGGTPQATRSSSAAASRSSR
jgi:hypothetical protein